MGLDSVELVMEVEDAFCIHISEDEAVTARTVGDVYQIVLSKTLALTPATACLSRVAFYRLRSTLAESLQLDAGQIRPRTSLASLLSAEALPETWPKLERAIGFPLPGLVAIPWLNHWAGLTLLSIGVFACGSCYIFAAQAPSLAVVSAIAAFCALGLYVVCMVAAVLIAPDRLPATLITVGDLVDSVKWRYREQADLVTQTATEEVSRQLWDRLVAVFCEQLGLRPAQVVPEAEIVRDLGCE